MQLMCSFIRDHDEDNFSEFVWNHPHLVYCPETLLAEEHLPAVDHEGAEYNLLQIAVIFNSSFFCQLILDILEHPHFPKRLFPTKRDEEYAGEMLHILHLYLNSGSVKTGDTPLHLASKFGFTDCCKIFLSHPLCEMDITNDDGLTPSQVICMNANESSSRLFQDLTDLFNDGLLYVPVFRSNRDLKPIIGKPCKCNNFNAVEINSGDRPKMEMDTNHVYFLKAFAGPMSSKMAEKFYTAIKRPSISSAFTPDEASQISRIKHIEADRGVERVSRSLAKDMNIEWKEFYPQLDVFTNLATGEGLTDFEKYWTKRRQYYLHCGSLPSTLDNIESMDICLSLLRRSPPHVNPLCHRANNIYCYHRKFIQVAAEDLAEEHVPALPSPLRRRRVVSQTLSADNHDIYMNCYSLSDLDKEIYMSIQYYNTALYPETHRWKVLMAAALQLESLSESDSPVRQLNPLKPIPVPKPHDVDTASAEEKCARLL